MLWEAIAQFHDSGVEYWACNQDEYADPGALDMTTVYPTLQNAGEICFFIQVNSSGTSGADTYQFILRGSATTDGTDLNGTTADIVTSPTWTQSGAFCLKTDHSSGLWFQEVPALAQSYRYWQAYCQFTTGAGSADLTVFCGLALRSALPVRVGSAIKTTSSVGIP